MTNHLGSARTEVVRFVGCGGLAPLLAPGRGTYRFLWSAAFQRCKKRAKILKLRQMRAFSGSVSEWCGRAVPARLLPGSCPVPARWPGRNRLGRAVPAQEPGSNRRTTLGCCITLVRTLPTALMYVWRPCTVAAWLTVFLSEKKKTCSGRMAGKEKENMKRKGKQRLVGEMAIRWIAIVYFCKFSCWRFFFFSTTLR